MFVESWKSHLFSRPNSYKKLEWIFLSHDIDLSIYYYELLFYMFTLYTHDIDIDSISLVSVIVGQHVG